MGPSPLAFDDKLLWKVPRELSVKEILGLQDKFVSAAKRAVTAGMAVLEIHAAHGYLLHQFYSPLTNKRTDQYGSGSFENRIRFLVETTQKVRAAVPSEVLVFVRLTGKEAFFLSNNLKFNQQ